jgi:hypothetical protein
MNRSWVQHFWHKYINGNPFNEFLFDIIITIITGIICGLISAGFVVFILEKDFIIPFILLSIAIVFIIIIIASIVIHVFHLKTFTIEKLKINGTIIISTINYILRSQERYKKEKDLNSLDIDILSVDFILDEGVPGFDTFNEIYTYSIKGTNNSQNLLSEIVIYLSSLITEKEFLDPNSRYILERDGYSYDIKPKIIDNSILAQINLDFTLGPKKLEPIGPNASCNYRFIRKRSNRTADMSGFLYVIDPYNFGTTVRELNIYIHGYDALYRDATVEVYEFNRENLMHKLITFGPFAKDTTKGCYYYNFHRGESDLMVNKLYGFMVVKK